MMRVSPDRRNQRKNMQRNHMCKGPEIRTGLMCLRSRQKGLCGWTLKGRDGCSEDHKDLGQEGEFDPKWHRLPCLRLRSEPWASLAGQWVGEGGFSVSLILLHVLLCGHLPKTVEKPEECFITACMILWTF